MGGSFLLMADWADIVGLGALLVIAALIEAYYTGLAVECFRELRFKSCGGKTRRIFLIIQLRFSTWGN
jgi:hypothetical protein